jgi:hypothetical protein
MSATSLGSYELASSPPQTCFVDPPNSRRLVSLPGADLRPCSPQPPTSPPADPLRTPRRHSLPGLRDNLLRRKLSQESAKEHSRRQCLFGSVAKLRLAPKMLVLTRCWKGSRRRRRAARGAAYSGRGFRATSSVGERSREATRDPTSSRGTRTRGHDFL